MRRLLVSAAAACGLLAVPAGALAATIEVDASADEYGTNAAACSLREAVRAANQNASFGDGCDAGEASLDVLDLTAGGYSLTRDGIGEDLNASGDLDIDLDGGPLRLQGPAGAPAAVDPATRDRAIDVSGDAGLELRSVRLISGDPIPDVGFNGTESGGALRWLEPGAGSGLTLKDSVLFGNFAFLAGALDLQTAGQGLIEDSTITQNSAADGGAVRSAGPLSVVRTTVSANGGGGLYAEGTGPDSLTLSDSAVTGNQIGADTSPVGGAMAAGDAAITNSTISDNVGGFVGGILAEGELEVSFSTIASNGAPDSGGNAAGGIDVTSADSVSLSGVILAGNQTPSGASNCNSPAVAEGPAPNLESAATCGLGGPGSLPGTDPQLAPLAANGGPTQTRGLYPGSPALDAGGACGIATDQRGAARDAGACDLGAFEGTVQRPPPGEQPIPSAPPKKKKKKCKRAKKGKGERGKGKSRCGKKRKRAKRAADAGGAAADASGAGPVAAAAKLSIAKRLIPYPRSRKRDMAAYSRRHYGGYRWRLTGPKLIVIHFAAAGSIGAIYNTFAPNRPDVEYDELPGVCTHYAVGSGGGAVKFVRPGIRCRHVVGLNHVALGVEHVGFSDGEVLGRAAQLRGSLRLVQSLRCRFGIPVKRVIGHAESLSSRFYKELDPDFRGRTHGDFKRASMRIYRRALRRLGPC